MSVYMNASLDIHSSLHLVQKRIRNRKIQQVFEKVSADIQNGKPVREAFIHLKHEKHLDPVAWSMLLASEQSGNISHSCLYISDYIKEHIKMKSSLFGALVYPIGMMCASLSMVFFLITMVFPKIIPMFASMGVALPVTARAIVSLSHFISTWGIHMLISVLFLGVAALYLFFKNEYVRHRIQSLILRAPYIGRILKAKEYNRIALTLGLLMNNHKTLHEATELAMNASYLLPFRQSLGEIIAHLQIGQKMSDRLSSEKLFESEWPDLVSVGELTGTLPKTFSDISLIYSEKYKDGIANLIRISEPAALLCSAFVVLIVSLAVIQPMYSLIQHINAP